MDDEKRKIERHKDAASCRRLEPCLFFTESFAPLITDPYDLILTALIARSTYYDVGIQRFFAAYRMNSDGYSRHR